MKDGLLCMIAISLKFRRNLYVCISDTKRRSELGIVVYAVIFGGFYFIFMRPQKKEQKRVQAMIADMEVGDTVLTTSGFYGVIIDISDSDVIVEFGSNRNCRIPMQKSAIAQVEKASAE